MVSLAGIFALLYLSAIIFFRYKSSESADRLTERIKGFKSVDLFSFMLFAVSLTAWVAFLYRDLWTDHFSDLIYVRLAPIMLIGSLVSMQAGIVLLLPHFDFKQFINPVKTIWRTSLVVLGGFAGIAIFISFTGIGFSEDNVGLNWGIAGVPLTFAQVNLVLSIGFLLSFLIHIIRSRTTGKHLRWSLIFDIGVFIILWGSSVILWSNQTMDPSHFSPKPTAPNYEYYPSSDALLFDKMSYHLSAGVGFSETLVRRPLYVGLVSLFHKIGGVSYDRTVFVQILFLALIPAFIYLLTTKLPNRLAGFVAGGLLILRETNAIDLSGKITTSHAKLIMSDLPATLGVVVFVYACIILFTKPKHDKWLLLIIGTILGLIALVRAQVLILTPLILLFTIFPKQNKNKPFISSGIILIGLILVITPWAWRNWDISGTFTLGDTGETMLMARNYSLNPIKYPQPLAGETVADYSKRLSHDISSFIFEYPGNAAFFISNHFIHSLATSAVYIAPLYTNDSPKTLISKLPFWDIRNVWDGASPRGTLLPLLCNLVILAIGIGLARAENKEIGLYPLMVFVVYQAGNALVRTSGWRFALPVDWIILMYYSIALSYAPSKVGLLITSNPLTTPSNDSSKKTNPVYPLIFILLFIVGISVLLAEKTIPEQKFDYLIDASRNKLVRENILTSDQLTKYLQQKNAVLISGIALYPRYFKPNGALYSENLPSDFKYLHFWLINKGDTQIVLPLQKPPVFFPHASTVSVLGCDHGDYVTAWAVFIQKDNREEVILREPSSMFVCP
ncbi:MAG: glycosyltransferase family 39 protein [Chloroflexi bacterium]|nr:glycosyltransferase family 39 protein [Chloroflexota bacterium]